MALDFFEIAYLIGLVVGSTIRAIYRARTRGVTIAAAYKTKLDALLLILASLGLLVIPLFYLFSVRLDFANYSLPNWAGWLGILLFAAALWLLWRSHADLGLNWTPELEIRAGHTLVTTGVFKQIRHPMYAAHILWGLAQPLLLHNWIAGFSMLVTTLLLYLVRLPLEERMLVEQFGGEYRAYMHHTGRLLPRLWGREHDKE